MTWGFPYALLLSVGAVPLILFLHSLRPRGARANTTALFLWERLLKERPIGRRIGWLFKKNLLLILQLLAALCLIAALADPSLLRLAGQAGDTIAVIDLSASMKARGRSGSRMDDARRAFLSLVDQLPGGQKMLVIGAGPVPRVLSPLVADKGRLRELGRALEATDAPAQVKDAVLFAHSFLKRGGLDRIVVVSDGAFDGAEELPWRSPQLRLVRIDGTYDNVGITGFEFRRRPDRAGAYEIMVEVRNFTPRALRTPLVVTLGEKPWLTTEIELAGEESRVLVYRIGGPLPARAVARLGIEDDFPLDNAAFLTLSEAQPLSLLYIGKGNAYLETLFRSLPGLEVARIGQWPADPFAKELERFDVVVVDGVPPPALAQGNFILINAVAPGLPVELAGRISRPSAPSFLREHPLVEGARLDDIFVREALRLKVTGDATVLAQAREGPLLVAVERGRLRALIVGFDLLASDLPFRVAFPILFSNAFQWFRPAGREFPARQIQAGRPYAIHVAAADDRVEVRKPSGRAETLAVAANPLSFPDTFEAGFYSFRTQSREGEFAVNLLSESESDIRPRVAAEPGAGSDVGAAGRAEAFFSLWPYLLATALVLLGLEAVLAFRAAPGGFYPWAARALAFAGIMAALYNPQLFKRAQALDVVLSVDFSRSAGQEARDRGFQALESARRAKEPELRVGLVFFGQRPVWEFFPRQNFGTAELAPEVGREETNIQSALQAAVAQIGERRQGRILLISDGNENRGEATRVVPLLRSQDVPVWVMPVNLPEGRNEIYLSELILPHEIRSGDPFEVRAAIETLHQARARFKILRDGVILKQESLELRPGRNWIGFKTMLEEQGNHTFEVLIESPQDTLAENNLLQGVVQVKGPPRVLYLHSGSQSPRYLARALAAQGYAVVEATPQSLPLSLPEIAVFDLLVLDNVPAYGLNQSGMETLERYVRDLGGGLIVVGGPQSYGAGGYYRTPLERILPVEMRPPARLDLPHVALLFVLDRSGSMGAGPPGATKLELAKAAAMAAADIMNPSDQIGILAFDADWEWVLPFRRVGKGEWISEKLAALQAEGGTDLYKALLEAERVFSTKGAAIKHLIVLSDGLTDKQDFPALVSRLARLGITVSTVAVGQDADQVLLSIIARNGKGRAYVTIDPQTIPQIFTTEALLISRDLVVEKHVQPSVVAAAGPLKGFFDKRFPAVRGYVLTHPKPRVDLLMKVGADPLLVAWRYGLGQVVAFTSDLTGGWGREWVGWEDFPQWAGQLARSAMRQAAPARLRSDLRREGDRVRAVLDVFAQDGSFINQLKLKGTVIDPSRSSRESRFRQVAPGRYETSVVAAERGIYLLAIREEEEGREGSALATLPFVAPYPKEYRDLKPNTSLLSRLAEETGGEVLDPKNLDDGLRRLFTPDPGKAVQGRQTWWPLSSIGLLLFLADLGLRRIPARSRERRRLSGSAKGAG